MAKSNRHSFHDLDDELKTDFYTSFKEAMDEMEHCFGTLDEGYQEEVVHEMFRAVHSIKGNCHLVFLDHVADVCHKLEDVVSQIRTGEYQYTPICGEFLTVIFQRLEQLVRRLLKGINIGENEILVLDKSVTKVFEADCDIRDEVMHQMLDCLSGVLSSDEDISEKLISRIEQQSPPDSFDEMAFMEHISNTMRYKSLRHHCKMDQLLVIAEYLCEESTQTVSFEQLKAAIYMNLLGNKFVTSPMFDIAPDSEWWEKERLEQQIDIAVGFLKFGGQWQDAAKMVEHSFARFDGRGLPENISGEQIYPGGMIIAILRFYQQQYRKACVENKKKIAVGKALRAINSEKGYRFDPLYVELLSYLAKEKPDLMQI